MRLRPRAERAASGASSTVFGEAAGLMLTSARFPGSTIFPGPYVHAERESQWARSTPVITLTCQQSPSRGLRNAWLVNLMQVSDPRREEDLRLQLDLSPPPAEFSAMFRIGIDTPSQMCGARAVGRILRHQSVQERRAAARQASNDDGGNLNPPQLQGHHRWARRYRHKAAIKKSPYRRRPHTILSKIAF